MPSIFKLKNLFKKKKVKFQVKYAWNYLLTETVILSCLYVLKIYSRYRKERQGSLFQALTIIYFFIST